MQKCQNALDNRQKKIVEEEGTNVLTDGKVLLQFPFASVIEAIIRNPDKYNDILVCNTPLSSTSMPAQQLTLSLHIESYKDMILDEDNRLYDLLVKHFTNTIMDNAVGASSSNSSLSSTSRYLTNVIWTEKKRSQKVFIRVKVIFLIDIIKILLWRTSDKDRINKELAESFNSTSSTMSK